MKSCVPFVVYPAMLPLMAAERTDLASPVAEFVVLVLDAAQVKRASTGGTARLGEIEAALGDAGQDIIKRVSDTLPPLTEAQRADLAGLLRGSEGAA